MKTMCGILGILLAAYLASYLVLCRGPWELNLSIFEGQSVPIPASYRYGGRWAEVVYSPLHRLDRRLRPGYWTFTFHSNEFNSRTDTPNHH